eukprot:TRINITY_DN3954_c0_g2_i1.p1 TRINITY_DN3954_c0_g2~~TRINITY_DN3954_c0_g2_i1.p1  ORF type:complete len:427 (-),score=65.80 TRINITY_DN3954_c0_g2_i1:890-2170(-)
MMLHQEQPSKAFDDGCKIQKIIVILTYKYAQQEIKLIQLRIEKQVLNQDSNKQINYSMEQHFQKHLQKQEKMQKKHLKRQQQNSYKIKSFSSIFQGRSHNYQQPKIIQKSQESMKIFFSGNSLAIKDEKGIIHYFPAKQFSPNFSKYCDINFVVKESEEHYSSTLKKYTSHESLYCTKINLLLAADGKDLSSHAKFINSLQSAIYYYASKFSYQVKKNQIVYRGMDSSIKEVQAFKPGEIIYFPSFMSTSSDKDKFYQGANYNTIFIIKFDKIPNCAFKITQEQSKYQEAEVLFKCYSKFKVEKLTNNVTINGKTFENMIELTHINEPLPKEFQNSIVKFFTNIKEKGEKQSNQKVEIKEIKQEKPLLEENKCCKIVIVGDTGVGKTSIINRYVENQFACSYCSTIGVDFKIKQLKLGTQNLKLML